MRVSQHTPKPASTVSDVDIDDAVRKEEQHLTDDSVGHLEGSVLNKAQIPIFRELGGVQCNFVRRCNFVTTASNRFCPKGW